MKLKITLLLIVSYSFFTNETFSQKINKEVVKSDLQLCSSKIRFEFISWYAKNEFETISEYNRRIINKENALDSIANSVLSSFLTDSKCISNFEIQLVKYSAEESKYDIRLCKKGMPYEGIKLEYISIYDTLLLESSVAKKLNELSPISEIYPNKIKAIPSMINFGIGSPVNNFPVCFNQWVINEFGFFFPISYKRYFDLNATLNSGLTLLSMYKINTIDLGLQKYFDENYYSKFRTLNDREVDEGVTEFIYRVKDNMRGNIYGSKEMILKIDYKNEEIEKLLSEIENIIQTKTINNSK